MSEARLDTSETPETDVEETEVEETEKPESEDDEPPEDDDDGEGEGEKKKPLTDWEKQAHDKAGQAAKERSRRRAAERSLADLQSRFDALETKLTSSGQKDELADLIAALRDEDDEPITDLQQIKRVLKTFIARQSADDKAEVEKAAEVKKVQRISSDMDAYEHDFASEHPDYFKAATYLRQQRASDLEDLGYTGQRLMNKLAVEFFGIAEDAMNGGRDPAEVVYGLAKKRGFKVGQKEADAKLQKLQRANGTTGVTPRPRGQDNGLSWNDVSKLKGPERDKAFAKLRARELGKS